MSNDFNCCPMCSSKNIKNVNNRKWFCPDCNFDLYNNVAAAVGCIITNEAGEVLFEVRGKEPRKDFLALPGGFVDPNETAEEAVKRECREELGIEVSKVQYLCSFPNTYEYRNITYKTCDLFFSATMPQNATFARQEKEVASLVWKKVASLEDIAALPLAFPSAKMTLEKWIEER